MAVTATGHRLEVFQSLWAMEGCGPDALETPLEQQFELIAAAGFDGVGIDHAARRIPPVAQARRLCRDTGLACLITAFPHTVADLEPTIAAAVALDSRMVCVNARYFPADLGRGIDFVLASLDLARQAGVALCFETHRFTLTGDLLYTLQLLEAVPQLQLAADLSHFVVAREFPYPVDERHQEWVRALLSRSAALQGRVATREQIQVALDFPQHRGWVEQFFTWWRLGMQSWCARMPDSSVLNFMCELGPAPYAITDASGNEMSDRWRESLLLMQQIRELWEHRNTDTPG